MTSFFATIIAAAMCCAAYIYVSKKNSKDTDCLFELEADTNKQLTRIANHLDDIKTILIERERDYNPNKEKWEEIYNLFNKVTYA